MRREVTPAPAGPTTHLSPVVVFAEIDQTFLLHAKDTVTTEAQSVLAAERIGLVFYSGMTRAELEMIQQELGLRQPFICESGAALLIPDGYFPFDFPFTRRLPGCRVIDLGRPYAEVVGVLHRTAARIDTPVVGFSDLSIEQVARESGLSLSHARLAKLREYDEPFRLASPSPDARHRLWRALRAAGLCCTALSVYEHVGKPVDKRTGVSLVTRLYRRALPTCVTIGLAAGSNTPALLHGVDVPFLTASTESGVSGVRPARFPRTELSMNQSGWLQTTLELARRVRQQRHPRCGVPN